MFAIMVDHYIDKYKVYSEWGWVYLGIFFDSVLPCKINR